MKEYVFGAMEEEMTSLRDLAAEQIKSAASLRELLDALKAFEDTIDQEVDDEESELRWRGVDLSKLPTFGGARPQSTKGVWSWDNDCLLVGKGSFYDWRIVDRKAQ